MTFERLQQGLKRTREGLLAPFEAKGPRARLDEGALATLEALLLSADVGPVATTQIVERLWDRGKNLPALKAALEDSLCSLLEGAERKLRWGSRPVVFLFVGVNGSGKTTTVAKVARLLQREGARPVLAAADTFRAAAIDQLVNLGERTGVDVVAHRPGADPGAVVHDAVEHAKKIGYDVVLVDTAGRLQTKRPLMEELGKVCRVVERLLGHPPDERILVVDATVGQNAVSQARLFHEAVGLTGIAVAKLDGTAKGGAIVPIWQALRIPILWIGVGEGLEDLEPFEVRAFARALVGR
jgi:fused signal recognition particle receptor